MKKLIKILLIFLLISCSNPKANIPIKEGFISEEGNYYAKNIKVIVKKLDDGSLIYAICDRFNKNLYQSNIMTPLSKYHFWMMFIDTNENIWIYNSDYDSKKVIVKGGNNQYIEKDYCDRNILVPKKFKEKLKEHNIKSCIK
jgi:hypothetical protein